jgi:hypothetical protein
MKNEPKELHGLRYKPAENDESDVAPEMRGLRYQKIEDEPSELETEATRRGTSKLARRAIQVQKGEQNQC